MKISEYLSPGNIKIKLQSTSREDVLIELISLLPQTHGNPETNKLILDAIIAREQVCSTGVGNGVAIPHAKLDIPGAITLAFGTSLQGVDFNAIDGKPVHIFFLLVAGKDTGNLHLKMLARISRLMHNKVIREKIMRYTSNKEVYEFFKNLK